MVRHTNFDPDSSDPFLNPVRMRDKRGQFKGECIDSGCGDGRIVLWVEEAGITEKVGKFLVLSSYKKNIYGCIEIMKIIWLNNIQ